MEVGEPVISDQKDYHQRELDIQKSLTGRAGQEINVNGWSHRNGLLCQPNEL